MITEKGQKAIIEERAKLLRDSGLHVSIDSELAKFMREDYPHLCAKAAKHAGKIVTLPSGKKLDMGESHIRTLRKAVKAAVKRLRGLANVQ
jgi:TATA-box binding protein (TBP) (component of TFIID and TFIIIB)